MILQGNCLQVLPTLEAESVDSVVTDPPYGLGFMGKEWDHAVPGIPFWEALLRVAKPGAYLVAFGGTRTYHRMACAIEDAGWELRDTLMWVYGSGFPKSRNGEWGGTALKPAWEPIVLARKPFKGTVAKNHAKHGTGGLNIDGCRIAGIKDVPTSPARQVNGAALSGSVDGSLRRCTGNEDGFNPDVGRWPANLVHDGSEDVLAAFPTAPGQVATASSSSSSSRKTQNTYGAMQRGSGGSEPRGDSGSAARFFYCAKASREDRDAGLEAFKRRPAGVKNEAGRGFSAGDPYAEVMRGNTHPTVKPTELMRWLCRLVTPPGGHVLDPFTGSGSTGRAAVMEGMRFTGIELDPEYVAIAEARIRAAQPGLGF